MIDINADNILKRANRLYSLDVGDMKLTQAQADRIHLVRQIINEEHVYKSVGITTQQLFELLKPLLEKQ